MRYLVSVKYAMESLFQCLFPTKWKEHLELRYWKQRRAIEGRLVGKHYRQFYTTYFGLTPSSYSGRRVLDIGCGPRGSLEWADMALERIGLDPLAKRYLRLGTHEHKMKYIASPAESMPFEDGYFDIVSSFNSLDHVKDVETTIREIKRVLRSKGLFLLLVDVNHEPTAYEPHDISWDIVLRFAPEFEVIEENHYEKGAGGMYESILEGIPYNSANPRRRIGVLAAKFRKL